MNTSRRNAPEGARDYYGRNETRRGRRYSSNDEPYDEQQLDDYDDYDDRDDEDYDDDRYFRSRSSDDYDEERYYDEDSDSGRHYKSGYADGYNDRNEERRYNSDQRSSRRGFAAMDPRDVREYGRRGGLASRERSRSSSSSRSNYGGRPSHSDRSSYRGRSNGSQDSRRSFYSNDHSGRSSDGRRTSDYTSGRRTSTGSGQSYSSHASRDGGRGFASMDKREVRAIAARGGRASHRGNGRNQENGRRQRNERSSSPQNYGTRSRRRSNGTGR